MLADKKEIRYRERPDLLLPVCIREDRRRIRFLIIASELRENLIEADADGTGELEFFLYPVPDLKCDLFCLFVI